MAAVFSPSLYRHSELPFVVSLSRPRRDSGTGVRHFTSVRTDLPRPPLPLSPFPSSLCIPPPTPLSFLPTAFALSFLYPIQLPCTGSLAGLPL